MKFIALTRELFKDNGILIKKLNCPFRMKWNDLKQVNESKGNRYCSECNHQILDTANYNEDELYEKLQLHPDTCLKIDLDQNNIEIVI